MTIDNPAHRLWLLLSEAKTIEITKNCKQAWAQLFNVKATSPDVFERLGKVMQLPSQIIAALKEEHEDELTTAHYWQTQLDTAFSRQNLADTWQSFIGNIDNHSINYLKGHAKILNGGKQLKALELDTLEQARKDLSELLGEVLKDDSIPVSIRQALARNLRAIIISLEEYKLTGSAGVFDSIAILYGQALFDVPYRQSIKADTPFGEKLSSILSGLANSMTVLLGTAQLTNLSESILLLAQKT
ncbi:hypothetical protein [Achromobacter xylosoxidans]|uniref:hypothetical protein n=1 Tax=Alcaligenes xylosoxydans xylosoxydans TaxID=85698 RepID=UPI001F101B45|nr:hypothetical protein [Achromobacter xylosoxidans]MCH4582508.1 hypothetical protein [Achromobacter xylosoxidans]